MNPPRIRIITILVLILHVNAIPFSLEGFFRSSNVTLSGQRLEHMEGMLCGGNIANSQNQCCDCDAKCMTYRTCCVDYLWMNGAPDSFVYTGMSSYINYLVQESSKVVVRFECVDVIPEGLRGGFGSSSYPMIATCSNPHADSGIRKKCLDSGDSNMLTSSPVLGDTGYLYKNAYCAHCNDVNTYTVLRVKCEITWSQKTLTIKEEPEKCVFDFDDSIKDSWSLRSCKKGVSRVGGCNEGSPFYSLCNSYMAPFEGFANIHCYLCSAAIMEVSELNLNVDNQCILTEVLKKQSINSAVNVESRFNETLLENIFTRRCQHKDFVYDIVRTKCVKFACISNFTAIQHLNCVSVKDNNELKFMHNVTLVSPKVNRTGSLEHGLEFFDQCLKNRAPIVLNINGIRENNSSNLNSIFRLAHSGRKGDSYEIKAIVGISKTLVKAQQQIDLLTVNRYLKSDYKIENVIIHNSTHALDSNPEDLVSRWHDFDFSPTFSSLNSCTEFLHLNVKDLQLTSECRVLVHGHTINSKHTSLWVRVTKDPDKISKHVSVCTEFYLKRNCTLDTLPPQNVTILGNGELVFQTVAGISTYALEEYIPTSHGFGVCVVPPEPPHDHGLPWPLTLFFIAFFMTFFFFFIKTLLE